MSYKKMTVLCSFQLFMEGNIWKKNSRKQIYFKKQQLTSKRKEEENSQNTQ